jgi:hypothetical protein
LPPRLQKPPHQSQKSRPPKHLSLKQLTQKRQPQAISPPARHSLRTQPHRRPAKQPLPILRKALKVSLQLFRCACLGATETWRDEAAEAATQLRGHKSAPQSFDSNLGETKWQTFSSWKIRSSA